MGICLFILLHDFFVVDCVSDVDIGREGHLSDGRVQAFGPKEEVLKHVLRPATPVPTPVPAPPAGQPPAVATLRESA